MLAEFHGFHQADGTPCGPDGPPHQAAAFLFETNIVCRKTLTGQTPQGEDISSRGGIDRGKPGEVPRDPFTLASLRHDAGFNPTVYHGNQACRIEKIHEQEKTDA